METDKQADVRRKLMAFWQAFFQDTQHNFNGVLVSAQCFFNQVWDGISITDAVANCNVRHLYRLHSKFHYRSSSGLNTSNRYSRPAVETQDRFLSARFHALLPEIVAEYRDAFIDQLRCAHFLGMAGHEAIMLYPSQQRRLSAEKVQRIAGEVRSIQAGFGDFRFNAPTPTTLPALLAVYTQKVESLLDEVDECSIHNLVSFAQYYFALLHPFYERCGRTSEELMYLLFERVGFGWRYISATGDRSSASAHERMTLINYYAEQFNRKIAYHFALDTTTIHKTPDIYRALTACYFPERYATVYAEEQLRPFYYSHPIAEIIHAYHFLMEGLLFDELRNFSLKNCYPHIASLGNHLRETGQKTYQASTAFPQRECGLHRVLSGMAEHVIRG